MGSLNVGYTYEHDDDPVKVTTEAEVDALLDRVCKESPEAAPILMQIYVPGAEGEQEFSVGVRGDRGVLRYAGRDSPLGVYSTGEGLATGEYLAYFYAGHWTGFPANSEIPLDDVRRAFKEYLNTDGGRPTGVRWQSGPEVRALEGT